MDATKKKEMYRQWGIEIADRILDCWFDDGHSAETEKMDRGYFDFCLEGRINEYFPRYSDIPKAAVKTITTAAEDHLGSLIAE